MDKAGLAEAFPSQEHTKTKAKKPAQPEKWWKLFGKDVSHVSVDVGYDGRSETSSLETSDLVKNVDNVFEAPEATEIYKPIAGFEGSHRFDPSATWTEAEEKTLVRRVRMSRRRRSLVSDSAIA